MGFFPWDCIGTGGKIILILVQKLTNGGWIWETIIDNPSV